MNRTPSHPWITTALLLTALGVTCFVLGLIARIGWMAAGSIPGNPSPARSQPAISTPVPAQPVATATPQAAPPTTAPAVENTPTVAATPIPPTAVPPTSTPAQTTYVVQEGDTLSAIARKFGVSVEDLQAANPNVNPDLLRIGTEIVIPTGGAPAPEATATRAATPTLAQTVYVVKQGDTVTRIAAQYGLTVDDLVRANPDLDPDHISTGQQIIIPGSR